MNHSWKQLEFDQIKEVLETYADTKKAKEKIRALEPFYKETELLHEKKETTEARKILDTMGMPPVVTLKDVEDILRAANQGACLLPEQLECIEITLTGVRRLKDFLERCKRLELSLPYYEIQLSAMEELAEEIHQKIRAGRVDDFASNYLKDLRATMERLDSKMRQKADSILKNNKECFADQYTTVRSGRICLPVKKEYKFRISGSVIDKSSTGATFFIEPTSVAQLNDELASVKLEEENEERRILYTLSAMVSEYDEAFQQNMAVIEKLDFVFAKGKLSVDMEAIEPSIKTNGELCFVNARHPFLLKENCVPLNFELRGSTRGIIITGPNTGGKTVAIKTVGLLSLMAQCGLHIPCERAEISMYNQVLCDIGDGQNISENLSTFSAHITNVLSVLGKINQESLVIMDELGSGTDPTEGMGIAIAILEELRKSKARFLVTTHYPEVKLYAEKTEGVLNARMAFDKESLRPLYQMELGEAGESCAFHIAKRLGMSNEMLENAAIAAYGKVDSMVLAKEEEKQIKYSAQTGSCENKLPSIERKKERKEQEWLTQMYTIGDSVRVAPEQKIGIVCQKVNEKGMLQVQMPNEKIWINHKRVSIHVKAEQLYPEDYDFSILFDSVSNRKARHKMEKGHRPDLQISYEE